MPIPMLQPSADDNAAVCAKFDGENPFTTCSFYEVDHLADLRTSAAANEVDLLEESGVTIGYLLAGNSTLVANLNRLSARKDAPPNSFRTRPTNAAEIDGARWGILECVVDEQKGGIVAYMRDDHGDRITALLNVGAAAA